MLAVLFKLGHLAWVKPVSQPKLGTVVVRSLLQMSYKVKMLQGRQLQICTVQIYPEILTQKLQDLSSYSSMKSQTLMQISSIGFSKIFMMFQQNILPLVLHRFLTKKWYIQSISADRFQSTLVHN